MSTLGRAMLAAVALIVLGGSLALAPAVPAAAATACRTVGGAPAPADGRRHATVVVDTGSGPVWSACISLSGTVSGIDALELAKGQISDLDPEYDVYTGVGRAVCKLRGTGNEPPDCLGKTAAYWHYERNGRYSSAGAGATSVSDGDVEGWRWGTGSASVRAATVGTQAATASVPPTRPAAATTAPPSGTVPGAATPPVTRPGGPGGTRPKGGAPGGAAPLPGAPTTAPQGAAGSPTTVAGVPSTAARGSVTTPTVPDPSPRSARSRDGGGQQAGVEARSTPLPVSVPTPDKKSGTSGTTSAVTLVGLLVVAGGAGVLVRKRRRAASATA